MNLLSQAHISEKREASYSFIWRLVALDFIYSGIVRGFSVPILANWIYFLKIFLLLYILLKFLNSNKLFDLASRKYIFLAFFLTSIQMIHFLAADISWKTSVYGWFLYALPLIGFALARQTISKETLLRIADIIEFSLIPNVIVVVLQVIFKNSVFYSAGFGEGLVTSGNIQRATGTFSSSYGFSLYLGLVVVILLTRKHGNNSKRKIYTSWFTWVVLVTFSGSRTVIFNLIFFITLLVILKVLKGTIIPQPNISIIQFLGMIFFSFASALFVGNDVISSFFIRWTTASSTESPLDRLKSMVTLPSGMEISFFGEGLGIRSLGSLLGNETGDLYSRWIEYDFPRIFVEGGIMVGIVCIVIKIALSIRLISYSVKNYNDPALVALASFVIPWLLFGQVYGHGGTSAGVWLSIYLFEAILKSGNARDGAEINLKA
jgi:hypothetical protein